MFKYQLHSLQNHRSPPMTPLHSTTHHPQPLITPTHDRITPSHRHTTVSMHCSKSQESDTSFINQKTMIQIKWRKFSTRYIFIYSLHEFQESHLMYSKFPLRRQLTPLPLDSLAPSRMY